MQRFVYFYFLRFVNKLVFCFFAVHYASGPLNSQFGIVRGMDGNVRFQFQGQASLFSNMSTPERDALILTADERIIQSILTIAPLENHSRVVYRKPDFVFRDAAPDTDQQLVTGEGQWIFTLEGEKYYLSSNR